MVSDRSLASDFVICLFPQQFWLVARASSGLLWSPTVTCSKRDHLPKTAKPSERLKNSSRTDVLALNGVLGGTETQTNILVPPTLFHLVSSRSSSSCLATPIVSRESTHATLAGTLGLALGNQRDVRLLLESTLRLDGQLGSHVCDCSCRSQRRGEGFGVAIAIENKGWSDSFNATRSLSRHLKSRKTELATLTS